METLKKHFRDPDELCSDIYCNGGISVHTYGILSSGYGGGIDKAQAMRLLYTHGYITGLKIAESPDYKLIIREINQKMRELGVPEDKLPFINTD